MTRILITEGRDYSDWDRFCLTLCRLGRDPGITLLIHGGCPTGADHFAAKWAVSYEYPCARVDPYWKTLGRKAGPFRNHWMIDLLKPDLCVAFPRADGSWAQAPQTASAARQQRG